MSGSLSKVAELLRVGVPHHTAPCGNGTWKSSSIATLSPGRMVIWTTVDTVDVPDPGRTSLGAILNLFKKYTQIGPLFFFIPGPPLRLSYQVPNSDPNREKFKAYPHTIVHTAIETSPLHDAAILVRK